MKISEAKELVKIHPATIGNWQRRNFPIANTTKINWVFYDLGDQCGASIGDGKIYGLKLTPVVGSAKVYEPNLNKVLYCP